MSKKQDRQELTYRCQLACGEEVPVRRVSAYEFHYTCSCSSGVISWAHKDPPPKWNEPEPTTSGQLDLFS